MRVLIQRIHVDPGIRVYSPGEELELPDDAAKLMIHYGIAAPVLVAESAPVVETATRKPRRREQRTR